MIKEESDRSFVTSRESEEPSSAESRLSQELQKQHTTQTQVSLLPRVLEKRRKSMQIDVFDLDDHDKAAASKVFTYGENAILEEQVSLDMSSRSGT